MHDTVGVSSGGLGIWGLFEIDALGGTRGGLGDNGADEPKQILYNAYMLTTDDEYSL